MCNPFVVSNRRKLASRQPRRMTYDTSGGRAEPLGCRPARRGRDLTVPVPEIRMSRFCLSQVAGRPTRFRATARHLGRIRNAGRALDSRCSSQLAEQAAAMPRPRASAEDRRRLLGHRHGRGQDQRTGHRAAQEPSRRHRCADGRRLRGRIHLRKSLREGRRPRRCSASARAPTSRIPAMNIAYVAQGGLGLPDRTYYFDKTRRQAEAYEQHIAKVLELSGIAAADAAEAGQGRDRVRNPPGQGVEVQRRSCRATCRCIYNPVAVWPTPTR
jgi:hypothetical protein